LPERSRIHIYGSGALGKKTSITLERKRPDITTLEILESYRGGHSDGLDVFWIEEIATSLLTEALVVITSVYYEEIEKMLCWQD
jgi:hypothetical protein